jgi:HtrA serine peptidase 2
MKVTAGISFAIPSDYVKQFLQSAEGVKKTGKAGPTRRYMGITMLTLTPQILHELQQRNQYVPPDIKSGVLVWKVILGSPAHSGGLQPGDIVTHIDGKQITGANDVYAVLLESTTRTITMTVNRNGKKLELHVTPENID